jgi:nucleotide-binding universal stress UspA family protein
VGASTAQDRGHHAWRAAPGQAILVNTGSKSKEERAMKTMVCAVDNSRGGAEALRVAAELSKTLGMRLVFAHVAPGYRVPGGGSAATPQARADAERLLDRLSEREGLNGDAERRAEAGDRASTLARVAAEEAASLIVVGARSQGRRRRTLLSGVAAELNATASCPVLVVPPPARR